MPAVCTDSVLEASVVVVVDFPQPPGVRDRDTSHGQAVHLAADGARQTFAELLRPQRPERRGQVGIEHGAVEDVADAEDAATRPDHQRPQQPAVVLIASLLLERRDLETKRRDARGERRHKSGGISTARMQAWHRETCKFAASTDGSQGPSGVRFNSTPQRRQRGGRVVAGSRVSVLDLFAMQQPHRYPSHRWSPPVYWHARPGATVDDGPLPPRTAARTRAIRAVFLQDFHGRATITEVGNRCDALGLLDAFSTHRSAYESIMIALRPIGSSYAWESPVRPQVSPGLPPG
jgi:hypothetical protein